MLVTITSVTKKESKFGAVVTTVTVENPNGNLQYFQLTPWNYKAAKLEGVMVNAERAVVNNSYDISFRSAKIKGRNITLLTKFSKASAGSDFEWEGEESTPVPEPVVTIEQPKQEVNTNNEINYDTSEKDSLGHCDVSVPVDCYSDYMMDDAEPDYSAYPITPKDVDTSKDNMHLEDFDEDSVPF